MKLKNIGWVLLVATIALSGCSEKKTEEKQKKEGKKVEALNARYEKVAEDIFLQEPQDLQAVIQQKQEEYDRQLNQLISQGSVKDENAIEHISIEQRVKQAQWDYCQKNVIGAYQNEINEALKEYAPTLSQAKLKGDTALGQEILAQAKEKSAALQTEYEKKAQQYGCTISQDQNQLLVNAVSNFIK